MGLSTMKQKIVIIGGGFGGIELAKKLRDENLNLKEVNKSLYMNR